MFDTMKIYNFYYNNLPKINFILTIGRYFTFKKYTNDITLFCSESLFSGLYRTFSVIDGILIFPFLCLFIISYLRYLRGKRIVFEPNMMTIKYFKINLKYIFFGLCINGLIEIADRYICLN